MLTGFQLKLETQPLLKFFSKLEEDERLKSLTSVMSNFLSKRKTRNHIAAKLETINRTQRLRVEVGEGVFGLIPVIFVHTFFGSDSAWQYFD